MTAIVDGSLGFTAPVGAVYNGLQSGTAQASTSGTSITFTGIPSWAKRITVMFAGVSKSGGSPPLFQLGTSGGIVSTGYNGGSSYTGASTAGYASTAGIPVYMPSTGDIAWGAIVFTNLTSNTWVASGSFTPNGGGTINWFSAGGIALGGQATQLRIIMTNGTDTFTAGSINILYE